MDSRISTISNHLMKCRLSTDFDPRDIAPNLLRHIYILDVEKKPDSGDGLRLRVRFSGTAIDHRFNRTVKGEFIDSYGHRGHSARVLEGFERCGVLKEPMWMRQVIVLDSVYARYIEGVAHYLSPSRIYGALVTGEVYRRSADEPELRDSIDVVQLTRDVGLAPCSG